MSKENHLIPLSPEVSHFHSTFVKSSVRWGRLNETEFMNFYELKNTLTELRHFRFKAIFDEMVGQAKLGWKMLMRKRLHFGLQSAKGRKEIKRLQKKHETRQSKTSR